MRLVITDWNDPLDPTEPVELALRERTKGEITLCATKMDFGRNRFSDLLTIREDGTIDLHVIDPRLGFPTVNGKLQVNPGK